MKRAVINVSVGSWYGRGAERLQRSLDEQGETADRLFFDHWPNRSHEECQYGFKVDAIMYAKGLGYDQVFWLDSSTWLLKPLPWDTLTEQGYYLGVEGWYVKQWCNQRAKHLMEMTQDDLEANLIEGKIMGFDFSSDLSLEFLSRWMHASVIGAFNGSWENHRHDITCGGVIARRMGLTLTPHTVTFEGEAHPDCIVYAQGMA